MNERNTRGGTVRNLTTGVFKPLTREGWQRNYHDPYRVIRLAEEGTQEPTMAARVGGIGSSIYVGVFD